MGRLSIASLILFFAGLVSAGGDSKADLKAMEGTWKATLAELDGKPAGDKEKDTVFKLVVKDGTFTVFFNDKRLSVGTLKLDPAKKPKEIDAVQTEGPFKGIVQKGVYEATASEMRVNFAEPGKDRPSSFKTREGEVLLHYTRDKDAKKK